MKAKLISGLLPCLLLAAGCETTVYKPENTIEKRPQMSCPEARQTLRDALQKAHILSLRPEAVQVTSRGFAVAWPQRSSMSDAGEQFVQKFHFSEVQHLAVYNPPMQKGRYCVHYDGTRFMMEWRSGDDARRFVDAVEALKYYSSNRAIPGDAAAFAEFEEKAKGWQALSEKPPLPEEVQRCKVLAEDAFQKQAFEKAMDYYEDGLAIEPLWPHGQLNAALLCGELEMYPQAVLHMKRYLALCPDVADAKKCRNQMWIWQEKVNEIGKNLPPADQQPTRRGGALIGW